MKCKINLPIYKLYVQIYNESDRVDSQRRNRPQMSLLAMLILFSPFSTISNFNNQMLRRRRDGSKTCRQVFVRDAPQNLSIYFIIALIYTCRAMRV